MTTKTITIVVVVVLIIIMIISIITYGAQILTQEQFSKKMNSLANQRSTLLPTNRLFSSWVQTELWFISNIYSTVSLVMANLSKRFHHTLLLNLLIWLFTNKPRKEPFASPPFGRKDDNNNDDNTATNYYDNPNRYKNNIEKQTLMMKDISTSFPGNAGVRAARQRLQCPPGENPTRGIRQQQALLTAAFVQSRCIDTYIFITITALLLPLFFIFHFLLPTLLLWLSALLKSQLILLVAIYLVIIIVIIMIFAIIVIIIFINAMSMLY